MALIDATGTGAFLSVFIIFLTRSVALSNATVGLGLSAGATIALTTSVPVGALADRYGPRRVLVAVSLWRALCFLAFPFVQNAVGYIVIICSLGLVDKAAAPLEQALVGKVVEAGDQVRTMAIMRSLRNVGFTLGALAGSLALALDTRPAYAAVLLANAASFAALAALAKRLPIVHTGTAPLRRTLSIDPLRDRPYLALSALNAVLTMHMTLLSTGIPLWISQRSHASRELIPPLIAVNTILAVAFQVRTSRMARSPLGAAGSLRLAGLSLAGCCLLVAMVPPLPFPPATALLVGAMVALTAGELFQSAGGWALSYELAKDGQQSIYLSLFWLSNSIQQIAAPLVVVGILALGPAAWLVLALMFGVAGCVVPLVTRWALASRAREAGTGAHVTESQ